eukprot:4165919-Pyramimonas_sp.AAC.2
MHGQGPGRYSTGCHPKLKLRSMTMELARSGLSFCARFRRVVLVAGRPLHSGVAEKLQMINLELANIIVLGPAIEAEAVLLPGFDLIPCSD